MTLPPAHLERVLAEVIADLEAIGPTTRSPGSGLLLWAYGSAYLPSTATRPSRAIRREDTGDSIPGPRYDLGIGNHRARTAYQRAVRLTGRIETVALVAHLAAGGAPWRRCNPRDDTRPAAAVAAVATSTAALNGVLGRLDDLPAEDWQRVRRAVIGPGANPAPGALYELARAARTILEAATSGGPATPDAASTICGMCGQAPALPKTGGRCGPCAYDHRAGKTRRAEDRRDAIAARGRRLARGEGFGLA